MLGAVQPGLLDREIEIHTGEGRIQRRPKPIHRDDFVGTGNFMKFQATLLLPRFRPYAVFRGSDALPFIQQLLHRRLSFRRADAALSGRRTDHGAGGPPKRIRKPDPRRVHSAVKAAAHSPGGAPPSLISLSLAGRHKRLLHAQPRLNEEACCFRAAAAETPGSGSPATQQRTKTARQQSVATTVQNQVAQTAARQAAAKARAEAAAKQLAIKQQAEALALRARKAQEEGAQRVPRKLTAWHSGAHWLAHTCAQTCWWSAASPELPPPNSLPPSPPLPPKPSLSCAALLALSCGGSSLGRAAA